MAVAKSYQDFEMMCEPFEENGKMYINVRNPKTKNVRKVRWYTDAEYAKMYPEVRPEASTPKFKNQKDALGFKHGYITIFKGETYPHLDWFRQSICRYARCWGWYVVSTEEVPADLPFGIDPVRLNWEDVGIEDYLRPEDQVRAAVNDLLYDATPSEFVGELGERIEVEVEVVRAVELDGYQSRSTLHIMKDANENIYVWNTAAKSWGAGTVHKIRGTVKDHRTYRREKQTVLTRCVER